MYAVGATAIAMLTGLEPEALPHKGLAIDVKTALAGDDAMIEVLERLLEPSTGEVRLGAQPQRGLALGVHLEHAVGRAHRLVEVLGLEVGGGQQDARLDLVVCGLGGLLQRPDRPRREKRRGAKPGTSRSSPAPP